MGNITVDAKGANTLVKVERHAGVWAQTTVDHDSMGNLFMQFLDETPEEIRNNILIRLVMKYQVSAHINTTDEEERLRLHNLTLTDDGVWMVIRAARWVGLRRYDDKYLFKVNDVDTLLVQWHRSVPLPAIFTVLKTLELMTGEFEEMGDGYFRWLPVKRGALEDATV